MSSQRFLRLFGPPGIHGPDGTLSGPAAQRHRLALLALLATAPRGILARDRIVGLLWPETDSTSARRLLNNAVHVIRQELGEGVVITEGDGLRFDGTRLRVDVLEFEAALKREDALAAVELYTGPFLDGLSLPDAVEFEQWQERERDRLERHHHQALERLAETTAREQGAAEAVLRWRQRLACTPADSRIVLQLMRTLADAGDRAGALQVASAHATLLREGFDAAPDMQVESLADQLRRESPSSGSYVRQLLPDNFKRGSEPAGPTAGSHDQVGARKPKRKVIPALAIVAATLGGLLVLLMRSDRVQLDENLVVIAPFENQTRDSALDDVGRLAAYWIADGLMRTQAVEVVPTPTALATWNYVQEQVATGRVREPVRAVAEETGAAIVILGRYTLEANGNLRFQAQISDAVRGRFLTPVHDASGPAGSLDAIDALSRRIMAGVASASPNLKANWSGVMASLSARPPTFEALQALIDGMEAWGFGGDRALAQRHFLRAADLDTSFIAALLWAGVGALNLGENARGDSLAEEAAKRGSGRLSPFERGMQQWIRTDARGDWNGVYRANQELSRMAPGSGFTFNVGFYAFWIGRPSEGIERLRRFDQERGFVRNFFPYWTALAAMHHVLGNHRRELQVARRGRRHFPNQRFLLTSELKSASATGNHQRISQLLEESLTLPRVGPSYLRIAEIAALELRAHGDSVRGTELAQEAVERYRTRKDAAASALGGRIDYARLLNVIGQYAEAYNIFGNFVRQNPGSIEQKANLAFSAARLGKRAEALQISQELATLDGTYLEGVHTYLRAGIAAALGEESSALQLLREAKQQGKRCDDELHNSIALLSQPDVIRTFEASCGQKTSYRLRGR